MSLRVAHRSKMFEINLAGRIILSVAENRKLDLNLIDKLSVSFTLSHLQPIKYATRKTFYVYYRITFLEERGFVEVHGQTKVSGHNYNFLLSALPL